MGKLNGSLFVTGLMSANIGLWNTATYHGLDGNLAAISTVVTAAVGYKLLRPSIEQLWEKKPGPKSYVGSTVLATVAAASLFFMPGISGENNVEASTVSNSSIRPPLPNKEIDLLLEDVALIGFEEIESRASEVEVGSKRESIEPVRDSLQDIFNYGHNINSSELLQAVAVVESTMNVDVGCNRLDACGLMQLKKQGAVGGIAALFSPDSRYKDFQNSDTLKVTEKRAFVDHFVDGYFGELSELYELIQERRAVVNTDISQAAKINDPKTYEARSKEIKIIVDLSRMIEEGYVANTNENANRSYQNHQKNLTIDLNSYLSDLSGEDRDWKVFLGEQKDKVKEIMDLARGEEIGLHVVIADTYLGLLQHKTQGNLKHSLEMYNKGNGADEKGPYEQKVLRALHTR